jgi:uncharacterized damage-inducible protein DinB
MLRTHFEKMFDWMAWADRRTIAAVASCPAAQAEALPLLAHLMAAEHVWLARLAGRSPRLPVWPTLTLAECEALAAENASGYSAYVSHVSDDDLAAIIEYRNQTGNQFATAVIDILTQIITHGPYHRGQIAKIIGRAGGAAPETDYIHYVRALAQPAA